MRNALARTSKEASTYGRFSESAAAGDLPTLRMTDYAISKRFYVESLGFQVFPVFAQVSHDGLAFFLTEQAPRLHPAA